MLELIWEQKVQFSVRKLQINAISTSRSNFNPPKLGLKEPAKHPESNGRSFLFFVLFLIRILFQRVCCQDIYKNNVRVVTFSRKCNHNGISSGSRKIRRMFAITSSRSRSHRSHSHFVNKRKEFSEVDVLTSNAWNFGVERVSDVRAVRNRGTHHEYQGVGEHYPFTMTTGQAGDDY